MRKSTTPSYGRREVGQVSGKRVADMLKSNPLSQHFEVPRIRNAKDALTLLLAEQAKYGYGNALDHISYRVLMRNFKLLLKEFTPEEVARGIVYAASIANFPSTTKHVKECILWIRQHL